MRRTGPTVQVRCSKVALCLTAAILLAACGGAVRPERAAPAVGAGPVRITYGPDPLQFGLLRVPRGPGSHPVAVLIHGGCWAAGTADLSVMEAISTALAAKGIATWNVEYRRVGDPGGGYPNTLTDVGQAIDALRGIAGGHGLDLRRVVLVGHSAGGQLAAWAAARPRSRADDPLRGRDPLQASSLVSLAGILDLEAYGALAAGSGSSCAAGVGEMIGGLPANVPARYAEASPIRRLPIGVPATLIHGGADTVVPLAQSREYAAAAARTGDRVSLLEIPGAGHFDLIDPSSPPWPMVEREILAAARRSTRLSNQR